MDVKREIHVISQEVGHIYSFDCWCEPNIENSKFAMVVRHHDSSEEQHDTVIFHRSVILDWITNFLNKIRISKGK